MAFVDFLAEKALHICHSVLVGGILGGFKFLHWGMELISKYVDISNKILPYVSFILIFLAILIGVNMLGKLIKKVIDATLLGNIDSLVGALVGMVKWAFAISIIMWISASISYGKCQ